MKAEAAHEPTTQDGLPVEDHIPTTPAATKALPVEDVPLTEAGPDVFGEADLLPDMDDGAFEALVTSIKRFGILDPLLYDENRCLLDGRQRLRAAKVAKLTSFPRITLTGLSDQEKADIRLEVNANRRHLSRAHQEAIALSVLAAGRSIRAASRTSGLSKSTVGRLAQAQPGVPGGTPGEEEPPRTVTGLDGKTYPAKKPTAVMTGTEHQQGLAEAAVRAAGDDAPAGVVQLNRMERIGRERASHEAARAREDVEYSLPSMIDIRHQRMEDLLPTLDPGSARLVFTDPPNLAEHIRDGVYRRLGALAGHVLEPGGFLVAYMPTMFMRQAANHVVEASDLEDWWTITSTFTGGSNQVQARHVTSKCRHLAIFRKPPTDLPAPHLVDHLPGQGSEKGSGHEWQQSEVDAVKVLRMLTSAGDLVVDPFLGSGTTAVAALRTGCRFLGSETEREHVQRARQRVQDVMDPER